MYMLLKCTLFPILYKNFQNAELMQCNSPYPLSLMEFHKPAHVVLVSSPGLGHLIPTIELTKRLVLNHNFKATILAVTSQTSEAETQIIKSSTKHNSLFNIIQIPSPPSISSTAGVTSRLCTTMRDAIPSIKSTLSEFPLRPSAFVVDIFSTEALPLAQELNIPKFVYVASHAWILSLLIYSPVLDQQIQGQYVDQKEPLKIPGCSPVQPNNVVDPMLNRNDLQYKDYLTIANGIPKCDAVLVNTWDELQRKDLEALRCGDLSSILKVPVFAIGPLVRQPESETSQATDSVLKWLDKQPRESVVYVSFGSGGTVSYEQMKEIAYGLELSGKRFVWVVRRPTVGGADAAFFTTGCRSRSISIDGFDDEIGKYLPEGFLERTEKMGLVVPHWAPQVTILGHGSIGGFITHCGWGSVVESITSGVPMVAWPLYAEQRMNAAMLVEEFGVAVRPAVLPTKKLVGREEIARLVREVVDEYHVRERVKEIKLSGERALSEGGSSYIALSQVAKIIHNKGFVGV